MSTEDDSNKKQTFEGSLDSMEQKLYSNAVLENDKTSLSKPNNFAPEDWQEFNLPKVKFEKPQPVHNPHKTTFLNWLLGGSVVFFLVSLSVAGYIFVGGRNIISEKNVVFQIDTPVSVSGGDNTLIQVTIENRNETTLLDNDFLIEYPEGVRNPEDLSKDTRRYRETLEDIPPGGKITKKINLVFFGESGDVKKIDFSLRYKVAGSNAILTKNDFKTISLSTSPVSVSISSPEEVGSGSEASFVVDVEANSTVETKNILLTADYPFGFNFVSSEPKSTSGNNVWDLGDLKPGSKRQIVIKGEFDGGSGEERVMRFLIGSKDPKNPKKIGVPFLSKSQSILVTAPSIGLSLLIEGQDLPEYITSPGNGVGATIQLFNGLPSKLVNVDISARLSGNIFDKNSVNAGGGFFKSADNEITWNQRTDSKLAFIDPGDNRTLTFNFFIPKSVRSVVNPSMEILVSVVGEYSNDSTGIEKVKVSSTKIVKLASDLNLGVKVFHSVGPFTNSGPVPPKVDQETTYTVVLSLSAGANGVSGGRVTTSLPIYSEWIDRFEPSDAQIMFNPLGGGLVWEAGDIGSNGKKEVAFQVAFRPSANQAGDTPSLLNGISATGKDPFSGLILSASSFNLSDISLIDDPLYSGRGGPIAK